jgi:hypothetical protein
MYYNHLTLVKAMEEDRITTKELFFYMNMLSRMERKKFICQARGSLLIK